MRPARSTAALEQPAAGHTETIAALRLIRTPSIGTLTFYRLIELYGTAEKAVEAAPEMARRGGKKDLLLTGEKEAVAELAALEKLGARLLLWRDADYPALLRQTDDAPPVLTLLGSPEILARPCIAMVGARNASLNGCRMAEMLAAELAEAGYTVVSGMARGIDAAAHKGAGIARTAAVLGVGIDQIYPRENATLYHALAKEGALLSEYALATLPKPENFPRRNRIISGLSLGTVVVEAATRSGSLITARLALEQGREVMAVPGSPLDPRAEGPNKLIREGATLVTGAADVIEAVHASRDRSADFRLEEPAANDYRPLDAQSVDELRTQLIALLSASATPVDDLIAACGGDTRTVLAALLELELAGRITRHPGNKVGLIG